MIKCKNIHKSFSSTKVLKGIDFFIKKGEIVGIQGSSGSGKTVFSRCITGLERMDKGNIEIEFEDLYIKISELTFDQAPWPLIRQKIGYVSQIRAVPPYRKVIELVEEGLLFVKKINKKESRKIAISILRTLGLEKHIEKYPEEISGGQLTRVCIARALVMNPEYIICDEISANLDSITAEKIGEILLKISKNGVGVIVISHQLEFLQKYTNRLITF